MDTDAFSRAWAETRRLLADGAETSLERALEQLRVLDENAQDARSRFDVAILRIELAVLTNNHSMHQEGVAALQAATPDELLDALRSVSEVALLGSRSARRRLLVPVFRHIAEPDDLGLAFLEDPGPADARAIAAGKWEPSSKLPKPLQREVRTWIAWQAIDAWLDDRRPEYLELIQSDAMKVSPSEPGSWEHALARAIACLAVGDQDVARTRVEQLTIRIGSIPWAVQALRRTMTAYAPLAIHASDWSATCPGGLLTMTEAADPLERVGASLFALLRAQDPGDAEFALHDAQRHPWAAFCSFVALPAGGPHDLLAQHLHDSIRRPNDPKRWPWPGRENAFAESCMRIQDRSLALGLLARVLQAVEHDRLKRACVSLLDAAEAEELGSLVGSKLGEHLGPFLDDLSTPQRAMLERGIIYRAVIDGTNVAYGGHSSRAGGVPELSRVKDAIEQLRVAGFTEILTYFDASTRHHVSELDWEWVEHLQVDKQAMVVRFADPEIIREFLALPHRSWVVTNDNYDEHRSTFPELKRWWPESRLTFFIHQDGGLRFNARLDRPRPGKTSR